MLKSPVRLHTIVDVTTIDLGRDVRLLEQVSRESGVQIICATGVWLDIPRAFWNETPDAISQLFIREIRETPVPPHMPHIEGNVTDEPAEAVLVRSPDNIVVNLGE